MLSDRRCFAWEWLRRSPRYRACWERRGTLVPEAAEEFGLVGWTDPNLAARAARPIWTRRIDPHVLDSSLASARVGAADLFDIRDHAAHVSVEIDTAGIEHWLLSDGCWAIRLDLCDGTLLGGPALLEQRIAGIASSAPKIEAMGQLIALAGSGTIPFSLLPRERRAPRWILELRVADALAVRASHQEMARILFGPSIAPRRWRLESASYRLRVQRLARVARRRLADPLAACWFS